jgi:hypothetical protein
MALKFHFTTKIQWVKRCFFIACKNYIRTGTFCTRADGFSNFLCTFFKERNRKDMLASLL